MPQIKPGKRITCQKPGFTIHKRHTTTVALCSFFNHKKQTSPVFALLFKHPSASKSAKVSPCRKTGPHSPCSQFTTNWTGELPNRSNHIHWERFHTTLDILRHGQTQAQPQSQHTHTLHSRPAAHGNILDGNLSKGRSKGYLFYNLLLTSCQFLPASDTACNVRTRHRLMTVTRYSQRSGSVWTTRWRICSQPGKDPINFLISGHLHLREHLLAEVLHKKAGGLRTMPVVLLAYAEVFWWPDSEIASRTFATAGLNMHGSETHSELLALTLASPSLTFTVNDARICHSAIPDESLYAGISFILAINFQPAV